MFRNGRLGERILLQMNISPLKIWINDSLHWFFRLFVTYSRILLWLFCFNGFVFVLRHNFGQFLWVVHSLPIDLIFFSFFCRCFYYLFITSNKPTNRKQPVETQQVAFYCILQPFIEPFSFKSPLKSKDQLHRKSTNCATTFVDVTSVQIPPGCFLFSSQLHCCLSHSLL